MNKIKVILNDEKKMNIISWTIVLLVGMMICLFFGEWLCVEDDSASYILDERREGVMPIYPFFLMLMRLFVGDLNYLNVVVLIQGLLAIFCTLYFVVIIQKQIHFSYFDRIVVYVVCLLPYAVNLPEISSPHVILTEGLTYPLFYLYFAFLLKTVWKQSYLWFTIMYMMSIIMALVRSQMLFLLIISLCVFGYLCLRRSRKKYKLATVLLALVIMAVGFLGGYKFIYKITDCYSRMPSLKEAVITEELAEIVEESEQQQQQIVETKHQNAVGQPNPNVQETNSQITSLLIIRGFFEAEEDDYQLFDNEMVRYVFQKAYKMAQEEERLYNYARKDLYMWKDIIYDRMGVFIYNAINQYDLEHPGERTVSRDSIQKEIGIKLIVHHLGRYIYHTIRLMIPSFISSVFFQIEPIYLLCHFITLVLYLAAIGISIYGICREKNKYIVQGMISVLFFNAMMVGIINAVFVGHQRYVIYGMGVFYCFMYLGCKEIAIEWSGRFLKQERKRR